MTAKVPTADAKLEPKADGLSLLAAALAALAAALALLGPTAAE